MSVEWVPVGKQIVIEDYVFNEDKLMVQKKQTIINCATREVLNGQEETTNQG